MSQFIYVIGDIGLSGDVEARIAADADYRIVQFPKEESGAVIIGNLENAITDRLEARPFKWACLRSAPLTVRGLRGLTIGVQANNHVCDFGDQGAADTRAHLHAGGIRTVGYGNTLDEAVRATCIEVGGRRLAVVALCCPTTNGENLATHWGPGVAPLGMRLTQESIAAARAQADIVIAYMHWGEERNHNPTPDQIRVGHGAVEAGADLVVGCHAHVVQSYECYQGKWIFYGLGNYLFAPVAYRETTATGALVEGRMEQKPANCESLVVRFTLGNSATNPLELSSIQAVRFDERYNVAPVGLSGLTAPLVEMNKRLGRYVATHRTWLRSRDEPTLRCRMRNGVLSYFYDRGPISDADLRHPRLKSWQHLRRAAAALFG